MSKLIDEILAPMCTSVSLTKLKSTQTIHISYIITPAKPAAIFGTKTLRRKSDYVMMWAQLHIALTLLYIHVCDTTSLSLFYLSNSACADSDARSVCEGLGVGEGSSLSPLRLSSWAQKTENNEKKVHSLKCALSYDINLHIVPGTREHSGLILNTGRGNWQEMLFN